MVPKSAFINKLHELHYSYKSQQARTQMYRKDGGTHCIFVRMKEQLTEDFVKGALAQAGLTDKEINSFIASAKS